MCNFGEIISRRKPSGGQSENRESQVSLIECLPAQDSEADNVAIIFRNQLSTKVKQITRERLLSLQYFNAVSENFKTRDSYSTRRQSGEKNSVNGMHFSESVFPVPNYSRTKHVFEIKASVMCTAHVTTPRSDKIGVVFIEKSDTVSKKNSEMNDSFSLDR